MNYFSIGIFFLTGLLVCTPITIQQISLASEIPSPMQQLQDGISFDEIVCKNDKILVQRTNGNPACVSENTANKMNWTIIGQRDLNEEQHLIENFTSSSNPFSDDSTLTLLNPSNLLDIVPQDTTYDYVHKMPPDDMDVFANQLIALTNDTIIDSDDLAFNKRYTTQKGWITMDYKMNTQSGVGGVYVLTGDHAINIDQADAFVITLLDSLDIELDGTELTREGGSPGGGYYYRVFQLKDDHLLVVTNQMRIDFDSESTWIKIGNWNDNLSDMTLYDLKTAEKNGRAYALEFDDLTGPECNLQYRDLEGYGNTDLSIIHGRPVYNVFAGICQTPYADGHYHWYVAFVDALTGKPLFIENKPVF